MASSRDRARLKKLLEICESLPEVEISLVGERHRKLTVGRKTFAYYLDDHHGDGIVSLCCKSTIARQQDLVAREPARYYVPAYVGPQGWVALRLDRPRINWGEVVELLFSAYRIQAPRRLADQIG